MQKEGRMSRTQFNLATGLIFSVILTGVVACAKSRPYEALLKENVVDKSLIDTQADYIYVPSVLDSSRTTTESTPYIVGDTKLVRLRFTQNALEIVETESDSRFTDNPTNSKLVLSIPIEHVDYKCRENSVGECSNSEEENTKLEWFQRGRFKADFARTRVNEVVSLPYTLVSLYSMGTCYRETSSRLVSARVEADAINIEVEKDFTGDPGCVDAEHSSSGLNFSAILHYSLTKLETLVSKTYEPVPYPEHDQGSFGFFSTTDEAMSVDNRERPEGSITYLNRWNPQKKEIVYYLSDSFAKPENKAVKAATYDAVAAINDGLSKSGSSVRLVLKEPAGKNPGDIRNSMIVMVEDPPAVGLLGYGPTIANPKTGEIISGRVAMYLGIMKQYVRRTYEEIRRTKTVAKASLVPAVESSNANFTLRWDTPRMQHPSVERQAGFSALSPQFSFAKALSPSVAEQSIRDYRQNVSSIRGLKNRAEAASKDCIYLASDLDFNDAVIKGLTDKLGKSIQNLPPWEELTETERSKLLDALVSYVWTPTLIHELGHNLGLRHNFQGSEDKENFYSKDELAAMGLQDEVPYSSVMEYSARNLNELRTMGKYDIAALRFGYRREVQDVHGGFHRITESLEEIEDKHKLKNFGYCTDEHADVNAGCKRFDEGTTLKEIAAHVIRDYKEMYSWRNFRNGARDFSSSDELAYAAKVDGIFHSLRLFFETYERTADLYPFTAEQWAKSPGLRDLDEAVQLTADFFLEVIATPDILCVLQGPDAEAMPAIMPITQLKADAISCFDPEIVERLEKSKYSVIAQEGKSFLSRKDPYSDNPYADQIDVRGIWIDKLLAAKYLLTRRLGQPSLDRTTGNYLDYKNTASRIQTLLQSILFGEIQGNLRLSTGSGTDRIIPIVFGLPVDCCQMIPRQDEAIRRALGLPETDTILAKELVSTIGREVPHISHNAKVAPFMDAFSVYTNNVTKPERLFGSIQLGAARYMTGRENLVANEVMSRVETLRLLSRVPTKKLSQLAHDAVEERNASGMSRLLNRINPIRYLPTEANAAKELGPELLLKYATGQLAEEDYYSMILEDVLLKK